MLTAALSGKMGDVYIDLYGWSVRAAQPEWAMSTSKRAAAIPLTEARARLFALVEELLSGRTERVALSHRGHDERVLLVRASDVERLEAELAALRRRAAVAEPQPLWGYATVVGDPETIVEEIRAEANRQREQKMREILGDPPSQGAVTETTPDARGAGARRRGSRARKSTP